MVACEGSLLERSLDDWNKKLQRWVWPLLPSDVLFQPQAVVGESIPHAPQALSELDADATATSIDGIRADDTISRRAKLQGLERLPGG